MMRDQERKHLEFISKNSSERKRVEANIAKLDEQIKQVCGEVIYIQNTSYYLVLSFNFIDKQFSNKCLRQRLK
jgi:hypothetical protein